MLVTLAFILWLIVITWIVSIVLTLIGLARQTLLSPIHRVPTSTNAPLVSILVPARNEQHRVLEDSIRSILAQDYLRFEVIAIDDRSTDATRAILESIARGDERLHVIEGQEPPAGWLGKPYAMQQGFDHARGEWILATDADIIFDTKALRTAMEFILDQNGDAISLVPHFEAHSFWERVMIPTWAWVFLMFAVVYRISNPKTPGAVGIGGFFLMRRTILQRVGGYEALKNEVMEDVRLAEMIKRSGARLFTEYAPDLVSTRMYTNFREMWECSTKTWFSGVKFSLPFALVCVLFMYLMGVVPPLVALVCGIAIVVAHRADLWILFIPAALSWLLQVIVLVTVSVRVKVHPRYALTAPLGLGLLYAMLFDSSIRISTGIGVTWKGRRIYESSGVRPPRLRVAPSNVSTSMDE